MQMAKPPVEQLLSGFLLRSALEKVVNRSGDDYCEYTSFILMVPLRYWRMCLAVCQCSIPGFSTNQQKTLMV